LVTEWKLFVIRLSQQELDDLSRADFLKSNPFYDGPFDPGMAAAYYVMQTGMESQRKAICLQNPFV